MSIVLATRNWQPESQTTSNRQNSRPRPAIQAIRVIRSTLAFGHVGVFCPRHCLLTPHPVRRTMEQRVGPNATAASVANGRQDNAHPAPKGETTSEVYTFTDTNTDTDTQKIPGSRRRSATNKTLTKCSRRLQFGPKTQTRSSA